MKFDQVSVPCKGSWEHDDALPREKVTLKLVCPVTLKPGEAEVVQAHTPDVGCEKITLWEMHGSENMEVSDNTHIFSMMVKHYAVP